MSLYKSVFANLPFGVLLYDRDGVLLDANPAGREILSRIGLQELLCMDLFSAPLLGIRAGIVRDQGLPSLQFEERHAPRPVPAGALQSSEAAAAFSMRVRLVALPGRDRAPVGYMVQLQDTTREKALLMDLEQRAFHDALTGLPNRELFRERLEQAIARARRNRTRFAILFLDLEDFKLVNDLHGHDAGDSILCETGRRIASCIRSSDTVARFGGDEFVVLLDRMRNRAAACRVTAKLEEAMKQESRISSIGCTIAISVGIALYPDDGKTAGELIHEADLDMYREKRKRKTLSTSLP